MADIIADSMNSQFLGMPTMVIVIILFFIIAVLIFRKPKADKFKEKDPKKEIEDNIKELMKYTGKKINKKVMQGMIHIGELGRMVEKNKDKIYEYYANPASKLKRIFKIGKKFASIPDDAILGISEKEIRLNPSYQPDNYLGVIIFSPSKSVILNETDKLNSELQIKSMVNWLPLQAYLSVRHAESSETLDHISDIEKQRKSDAVSDMTGKSKR